VFTVNAPYDALAEFNFGLASSNLYQIFSAGSLYVQALFTTTCPTAHVCAPAREMQTNTQNTPKSRMQHTPRAFIHPAREL
jgi:hypothetical protein